MSYLSDYVYYGSGTEVPESYLWWAGLSILGHVLGRKVWVVHGDYFDIPLNLFGCLVGTAGTGKNTGMSLNKRLMYDHFPELMVSASIQSREDIAYLMTMDDCIVNWQDKQGYYGQPGKLMEYRPFYILNDELLNLVSVDKTKMTGFLLEVFDGQGFSTGFKGDRKESPKRLQHFKFPHVSLLTGAVPDWFMSNLKMDLFTGGLGRRLFIISDVRTKTVPRPMKPMGHEAALGRVIEYLKKARFTCGPLELSDKAIEWWDPWYIRTRNKPPEDTILAQFHETRHVQTLKLAGLLTKSEDLDSRYIGPDALQGADSLIQSLQEPILKLTSGVGRNESAGVANEICLAIDAGGIRGVTKKRVLGTFWRNVPGGMREIDMEILPFLQKSDKIIAIAPKEHPEDAILFTPENYKRWVESQKK